jgi:hypothetical protein
MPDQHNFEYLPLIRRYQRSLRDVSRATPDDERECERAEAGEVEQ